MAAPLPDPRSTLLDDVTNLLSVLNRTLQTALTDPAAKVDDYSLAAAGALLDAADTAIKACAAGFPTEPRRILTEHRNRAVRDYDSAHHAYKALRALHGVQAAPEVVIRVDGDVTPEQVEQIVAKYHRTAGRRP